MANRTESIAHRRVFFSDVLNIPNTSANLLNRHHLHQQNHHHNRHQQDRLRSPSGQSVLLPALSPDAHAVENGAVLLPLGRFAMKAEMSSPVTLRPSSART